VLLVVAGLSLASCGGSVRVPEASAPRQAAPVQPIQPAPAEPPGITAEPVPERPPADPSVSVNPLADPAAPGGIRLTRPRGAKSRVALLLPLSGREAVLGAALLDAAQLAVFEVADKSFELMPFDSGDTPAGAIAAAEKAIAAQVSLILGPVFASATTAIAPMAADAGINVISFSNDRSIAGGNIFVMGLLPAPQIVRAVGYAASKDILRFAIFAPDTDYGRLIADALRQASEQAGGTIVLERFYSPQTADLAPEVRRLGDYDRRRGRAQAQQRQAGTAPRRPNQVEDMEDLPFQALILPEFGERLKSLAPLLPFYGVDKVKLIGTSQWDDPSLFNEPALFGAWYAAPASAERAAFVQRYERAFGRRPHRLASLAYDATALAAVLARQPVLASAGSSSEFSAATLQQPSGFQGVDGIFRFGADGAVERGLAMFEIVRRGQRVIDPAPESFAGAIN